MIFVKGACWSAGRPTLDAADRQLASSRAHAQRRERRCESVHGDDPHPRGRDRMDGDPRPGRRRAERQRKVSTALHLRFEHRGVVAAGRGQAAPHRASRPADHPPSGVVVVEAQRYRGQDKNRADACSRAFRIIAWRQRGAYSAACAQADAADAQLAAAARGRERGARRGQVKDRARQSSIRGLGTKSALAGTMTTGSRARCPIPRHASPARPSIWRTLAPVLFDG